MTSSLHRVQQEMTSLEEAMADWRQVALTCQPWANASHVRSVCETVVKRAHLLAETSSLRFTEVAGFLLTRSRAWVLGGVSINDVEGKLPKTLGDLGMLKLAEGGDDGGPLAGDDLKRALAHKKRIIH